MEIKWSNISMLALLIFAFFTAVGMHEDIGAFLGMMRHLGADSSVANRTHGLMAFGLLMVVLVAVLKILIRSQNGKR